MTTFINGHASSCWSRQLDIAYKNKQWWMKYPNACLRCEGVGGHSYPSSFYDPGDFDTCANCIEKGKCPLCGTQHNEEWEGDICLYCGWDSESFSDHCPTMDYCGCDYLYEKENPPPPEIITEDDLYEMGISPGDLMQYHE